MSLVYWDTMLFIYWFEGHPVYGERVRSIYQRMQERKDTLCSSAFVLGETLVGPYRAGARDLADRTREAFRPPFVEVLPFTTDAADQFARIRADLRVSPIDAIHLACAAEARVDLFLTNDRKLVRHIVPGIQFIATIDSEIL